SRLPDGTGAAMPAGALSVECSGVSFSYGEGEPVLRDITFTIEPGTVVGLLGRTGSGKTTLARLLPRLADPTIGLVRLSGVDIREVGLAELRGRVAMVTQEVQLFAASVRDNLTFFNPAVSDARLLAAIEELGLGAWCRALPDGLDTMLAPGGGGLSA